MRYLKNKTFHRDLKDHHLDDEYVKDVLDDIFKGRATALGSKIYKIRAAPKGQGKSGGFRNLFFWKRGELIVFCLLFAKNEQDNLTVNDQKSLKIWSDTYDRLTEGEVNVLIKKNTLKEIYYDR